MLLQVGPIPTDDINQWTRTARRILCELRVHPGDLDGVVTDDLLDGWSSLVDAWSTTAAECEPDQFCWFDDVDNEQAEYLLHGLDIALHLRVVREQLTDSEFDRHRSITMNVVQAFVDGLSAEGRYHEHLVDQVRASFGAELDH